MILAPATTKSIAITIFGKNIIWIERAVISKLSWIVKIRIRTGPPRTGPTSSVFSLCPGKPDGGHIVDNLLSIPSISDPDQKNGSTGLITLIKQAGFLYFLFQIKK